MTVRELLGRIDARELAEWMAYYSVEPFGQERDNFHAGIVAATTANVWRGKGKKALKPGDFLLQFGAKKKQTPEEMRLHLQAFAAALSAGAKKKGKDPHGK